MWSALSKSYETLEQPLLAIKCRKRALETEASDPRAYAKICQLYAQVPQTAGVIRARAYYCQKYLEVEPDGEFSEQAQMFLRESGDHRLRDGAGSDDDLMELE